MRRIALLVAGGVVFVLACTAALAMRVPGTDHAGGMDSCLARHGWAYGLQALETMERRVGHPNGLVRICNVEVSNSNR